MILGPRPLGCGWFIRRLTLAFQKEDMTRPRRYLLILGLLLLAVLLAYTWVMVKERFPNAFDRETEDAAEVEQLKAANLARLASTAADWPQFLGPNRDGFAPSLLWSQDSKTIRHAVKWSTPCGGGYSSLAVIGGRVYTQDKLGGNERLICLDAADGKLLWEHSYPVGYTREGMNFMAGPRATPTVHDGRIYTVGAVGKFQCLKLPTKPDEKPAVLWEHDLLTEFRGALPTWGVACSPLIEGELVVVQPGGKDGSVAAFDRVRGERRWAVGKDPSGYSSPVAATLGGVRQVVAITGKAVLGIRATDGKLLWEQPWETKHLGNVASPVVVGEYVFVSSSYGKGCACFRVTATGDGRVVSKVVYFRMGRVMQNHHSTCVHKDGFLFGYDNDQLKCVNLRDGTEVEDWPKGNTLRSGKGSVILAGNYLIGLTERGDLFVTKADPTADETPFRWTGVLDGPECWAVPAFADGKVFARDGQKVVCVELNAPSD